MRLFRAGVRVHFVGVGGIGLSAIARVLHGWGYSVSGSDLHPSPLTDALTREGIPVFAGHRPEHVRGPSGAVDEKVVVVVSSAVPDDNSEVVEARRLGFPVVRRASILGELTAGKQTIAVAGTHGKTTTSAMIAWILTQAELDPTFIIGGLLENLGTNARPGHGPHFVIEADEYDRTFLGLKPDVAVVTTLEHDHPDCYPTFEEMQVAFSDFVERIVEGGLLIICGEEREARKLGLERAGRSIHEAGSKLGIRRLTYGFGRAWDWSAEIEELTGSPAFSVWRGTERMGPCALQIPGRHNVLNALAALAVTVELGVDFGVAASALTRFRGTERRFEIKGQAAGITVIDDYAHHPTEIRATLAAARTRYPGQPIWAVFQPHTYSRTAMLLDDFAGAFGSADHVLVTDIYAAREQNTFGVSGADIVARMATSLSSSARARDQAVGGAAHPDARYVESLDRAVEQLLNRAQSGDVIITLGAGDGYVIGERMLEELQNGQAAIRASRSTLPVEQRRGCRRLPEPWAG
jgi:UDP-N-acetylmuramate--alanine ligase